MQLLEGDPELDFLALVRMDGYALIIDRSGWRDHDELEETWRPVKRSERSGIETVPLFKSI